MRHTPQSHALRLVAPALMYGCITATVKREREKGEGDLAGEITPRLGLTNTRISLVPYGVFLCAPV